MEACREDIYLVNWSVCRMDGDGQRLMAGKQAGDNNNDDNNISYQF